MPRRYEHTFDKKGNEFKRCSKCEEYKLLDQFNNDKSTYDKLSSKCKDCCRKTRLKSRGVDINLEKNCLICKKQKTYDKFHSNNTICIKCVENAKQNDMKPCFGCNEIKFNAEFNNSISKQNGKQSYCIECQQKKKQSSNYKLKHKEYMKDYKQTEKYKNYMKKYNKTYTRKTKRKQSYLEDTKKETLKFESLKFESKDSNSSSNLNSFDSDDEDEDADYYKLVQINLVNLSNLEYDIPANYNDVIYLNKKNDIIFNTIKLGK